MYSPTFVLGFVEDWTSWNSCARGIPLILHIKISLLVVGSTTHSLYDVFCGSEKFDIPGPLAEGRGSVKETAELH